MRGFCLGLPFLSIDFLAVGVFQAVGMGRESLLFAILRKIVLEIPALFILNSTVGLYGLAYAQFCAEVILATAAIPVSYPHLDVYKRQDCISSSYSIGCSLQPNCAPIAAPGKLKVGWQMWWKSPQSVFSSPTAPNRWAYSAILRKMCIRDRNKKS